MHSLLKLYLWALSFNFDYGKAGKLRTAAKLLNTWTQNTFSETFLKQTPSCKALQFLSNLIPVFGEFFSNWVQLLEVAYSGVTPEQSGQSL